MGKPAEVSLRSGLGVGKASRVQPMGPRAPCWLFWWTHCRPLFYFKVFEWRRKKVVCLFLFFLSCSGALKDSSGACLDKDQPLLHPNTHESTPGRGLLLKHLFFERKNQRALLAPAGPGWWPRAWRAECMDCQGGAERAPLQTCICFARRAGPVDADLAVPA